MTEQIIKNEILQHFKYNKEVMLDNIKNMGTARFNKSTGKIFYTRGLIRRGVADLLGMIKGRYLAIEVKTPQGLKKFYKDINKPPTHDNSAWYENEWGKEVLEKGGIYIVADSVAMVMDKLREFISIKPGT